MKPPATARQRLVLATAVAFLSQFLLSGLLSWLLPQEATYMIPTRAGFLDPIGYLLTVPCMAAGGWIGGRRFLPVALAITVLILLSVALILAGIALPATDQAVAPSLGKIVGHSGLGWLLALLATAAGVLAGAALRRRNDHPPTQPLRT